MKTRKRSINFVIDNSIIVMALSFIIYQLFYVWTGVSESMGVISINEWMSPFYIKVFSLLIVAFCCILWLQMIRMHKYMEGGQLDMLALLAIIFTLFPNFFNNIENAISLLCLTFTMNYLLQINKQHNILRWSFNSSVFLGITVLLFPPALFLLLFIWIMIGIIRPFELRDYVISIVGLLMPAFYLWTFSYLLNYQLTPFEIKFDLSEFYKSYKLSTILLYLALSMLFLIAVSRALSFRTKMVVHQRKQMQSVLLFSIISLTLVLLFQTSQQTVIFAAFPLSFFAAFFQQKMSYNWILKLLLLLLLLAYFWQSIFGNFPFL